MPRARANDEETIASLIQKAIAGGATYEGLANASGNRISPNYLHDLGSGGPTERLSVKIIVGLGKALSLPPAYVFQVAARLAPETKNPDLHQMVDDYSDLPESEQHALEVLVDNLKREVRKRKSAK